ncbi:MAG: hypothetical protein B7Z29_17640 [Hyphomicrobium sp. 12-62-95]|nr:MAG: hypothetical protein B7Z29_17640 [Hyphomicrobium sp. 12-62-95]
MSPLEVLRGDTWRNDQNDREKAPGHKSFAMTTRPSFERLKGHIWRSMSGRKFSPADGEVRHTYRLSLLRLAVTLPPNVLDTLSLLNVVAIRISTFGHMRALISPCDSRFSYHNFFGSSGMHTAILILIIFGASSEPLVLSYPQPNLAVCWIERDIERRHGILRSNNFQVHALCLPEAEISSSTTQDIG